MREKRGRGKGTKTLGLTFFLILFIGFIGFAGIVSASYKFSTSSVETQYSSGEFVRGTFNMSFTNQKNSDFTSNLEGGGSKSLISLLEDSGYTAGTDYTCEPEDCEEGFTGTNGQTIKQFNLNGNKTFGFLVSGEEVVSIDNAEFSLTSSIESSCINQITMDIFDDGDPEFFNSEFVDEVCGVKNFGCFEDADTSEVQITGIPLCEKISLEPAPAYRIGANIKNSTTGKSDLYMEIYDAETGDGPLAGCKLSGHTSLEQNLDCLADYGSRKRFDAFVCIYADDDGGNYKIKAETEDSCGVFGLDDLEDYDADYEIYAERLRYGAVDVTINETLFEKLNSDRGTSFADYLMDYVNGKYFGGCDGGCLIPIKLSGGVAQDVTLNSLDLGYESSIGPSSSNKFYDVTKKEIEVTTTEALDFSIEDVEIKIPEYPAGTKAVSFSLMFAGSTIIQKILNVTSSFNFSISPRTALIGIETEFSASIVNATSAWDFGDGTAKVTSNNNKARHIFTQSGEFNVKVTLTKGGKDSTKSFIIIAGNPEDSAKTLVEKYEKRIKNLTAQRNSFSPWILAELDAQINIPAMNQSVSDLRDRFNAAETDEEYELIINDLIALDVPKTIRTSKTGTLPLSAGFGNIDSSLVMQISGANNSGASSDKLKDAITAWAQNNYDSSISFEVISADYDSGLKDIVAKYKITLTKNAGAEDSGQVYLLINYPKDEITFMNDYSAGSAGISGTYIPISDTGNYEFILPGYIEVSELGVYVSPAVSRLGLSATDLEEINEGGFAWGIFFVAMLILIVVTLIIYIILQEWYKRKYESYLFKEPNQLYNLINFIYNARTSGMKDVDIKEKLKKAGWKNEQIVYAFKKIDGKRTGMWEIPIFKFFENKKVEDEIAKRHHGEIDTKFVKRAEF